jgi:hypothetical protein
MTDPTAPINIVDTPTHEIRYFADGHYETYRKSDGYTLVYRNPQPR